jgi:hypothetical protein
VASFGLTETWAAAGVAATTSAASTPATPAPDRIRTLRINRLLVVATRHQARTERIVI